MQFSLDTNLNKTAHINKFMNRAKIFITFTFLLAFALQVSAQENPYPNELEGFEFFGKGKLKGLKLGVSSKEDVKDIFGTKIKEFYGTELYDYDTYWLAHFTYFDAERSPFNTSYFDEGKWVNKRFTPLPEYIGKLQSIRLIAKSPSLYNQLIFSDEFNTWSFNKETYYTSEEFMVTRNDFYQDSFGLKYEVFNKVVYNNNPNIKLLRSKGDLISIEYKIPNETEKLFFEQK